MNKIILSFGFFLITILSYSQVGINTTTPDISAALDITSSNSGVLLPRISLISTTDVLTIVSPANGLVCYNIATTADVTPGFYYFDNSRWNRLMADFEDKSWKTEGNTLSGTEFLGSLNNQPLTFRVNNIEKLQLSARGELIPLNTGNSVFLGLNAGTSDDLSNNRNVFIGEEAGTSAATGGVPVNFERNIAIGYQSKVNGNRSTAVGAFSSANGGYSSAFGDSADADADGSTALGNFSYAGGTYSSAIGSYSTSLSDYSVAIGPFSYNSGGVGQIAIGYNAFTFNEDAISIGDNVYTGALKSVAIGSDLVNDSEYAILIGDGINLGATDHNAVVIGRLAESATNSVAIGYNATAGSNSVAIGYNSVAGSNQITLGNSSITQIGGYQNWSNISDGRFKYDVEENVPGLSFVKELRPVTYKLNREKLSQFKGENENAINTEAIETGFIAQEVEQISKKIGYNFSGLVVPEDISKDNYALRYAQFVVPLVKAVQEQQEEIEELKRKLSKMEAIIMRLDRLESGDFTEEVNKKIEKKVY